MTESVIKPSANTQAAVERTAAGHKPADHKPADHKPGDHKPLGDAKSVAESQSRPQPQEHAAPALLAPAAADRFGLNTDVEIVRRQNSLLLFSLASGRSVRVSPVALSLLPLLQQGASFAALCECLRQAHPQAPDIALKLAAFLRPLSQSGILWSSQDAANTSVKRVRRRQYPLFNPNPLARIIAAPLVRLPQFLRRCFAFGLAFAALACIALLAWRGALPNLATLMQSLHWGGLVLFALVLVPIHEAAHAVACRLVGLEVGAAGLILHGGLIPGPYVDTSQSYRLTARWQRFVIPAAGPWVNLLGAGVCAALLLWAMPTPFWTAALHTALLVCLLFVYFDTNPFTSSDGSHCLEAWLDDELARRQALRPGTKGDQRTLHRYRWASVIHLCLGVTLLAWWWFA